MVVETAQSCSLWICLVFYFILHLRMLTLPKHFLSTEFFCELHETVLPSKFFPSCRKSIWGACTTALQLAHPTHKMEELLEIALREKQEKQRSFFQRFKIQRCSLKRQGDSRFVSIRTELRHLETCAAEPEHPRDSSPLT